MLKAIILLSNASILLVATQATPPHKGSKFMKYIVAHSSTFNHEIKIGAIEADSPEQAILIAAERDGWAAIEPDETVSKYLKSIEDQYVAYPLNQVPCYPETKVAL